MGVTLYFSNQLMPLAQKLEAHLTAGDAGRSVLEPPVVIVPNMNLSKWLKLTLARRCGICMNISFAYLESGLWQMLQAIGTEKKSTAGLLDRAELTLLLFFLLLKEDEPADTTDLLCHYVHGNRQGSEVEIRAWQLAEELARLFQEYEYHRADMIGRWLDDQPVDDPMEAAQKAIYRQMMALKQNLGDATGQPRVSMAEAARTLAAQHSATELGAAPRVHFFGLSQISPFHLQLLGLLNAHFDIRIYSLNPSQEYWEDIQTPFEKRWMQRKLADKLTLADEEIEAGDLFATVDHPLLSAWGKPGRESIRLLCQLTDYDFQAGFTQPPPPETVLGAVANGILTLDLDNAPDFALAQDTSLQIVGCPGIRREVETVYNSILYNLERDDELCMTDIAVMVVDMARYKPVVDSVFGQQPARLSYNLVDSVARTQSVFAQAVMALMELARGPFSRRAVFQLLRNPCVMQRWGYGAEELSIWARWAEALGIFHTFEQPVAPSETGPAAGRYTWRQGLERLRLARIMSFPETGDELADGHYHGLVPYSDLYAADERLLQTFCFVVESLSRAMQPFERPSAKVSTWRSAFFGLLDQFVSIPDNLRGEETVYQSLVMALDQFDTYDVLMDLQPGRELSAEALWGFVGAHLDGIAGGQGDYLTGGVTVSALMPMRPIPFKVVYVLGLEEGGFPGRSTESLLDLRCRQRRIGDISLAERNRYLFLEILISVRQKLYLSYISRDLQKDRDLAACSVVQQLRRYIEQRVLAGDSFKVCQIPIQPDSSDYLAADAVSHWSDVKINTNNAQRLSSLCKNGFWERFEQVADASDQEIARRYGPDLAPAIPAATKEALPATTLLTGQLRRFLLNPVAMAAAVHLGIHPNLDLTDPAEADDEPLVSVFPIDYHLRTRPLRNWIQAVVEQKDTAMAADRLAASFDAAYADYSRKSLVPAGAFAGQDKQRLKEEVLANGQVLNDLLEQMAAAPKAFSAVLAGTDAGVEESEGEQVLRLDPLVLTPEGQAVQMPASVSLSGRLPWSWQGADGQWNCLVISGSNRAAKRADRYVLDPLLTLLALCASGQPTPWANDNRITIHVAYRDRVQPLDYRLDPDRSRVYLQHLVGEYYRLLPLLWLPFETVFSHKQIYPLIVAETIDDMDRIEFAHHLETEMQNNADICDQLTGATVTGQSLDVARRRFRIFHHEESAPPAGKQRAAKADA